MKIAAITVGGFRNVAKTRFELGGIVGLVSPNNYGKSNVLSAIDFAIDFINASPKTRRKMMAFPSFIPLTPSQENDDYSFLVEFEDVALGEYRHVRYGFSFRWFKDDGTGCKIVSETLECNSKAGGKWSSYLKQRSGYRVSHKTRSFRNLSLDDDQLAVDVLTAIDDIEINPVIRKIRNLRFDLAASIDADERFSPNPIRTSSAEKTVAFDSEDLARQLFRLNEEDPCAYDAFEEAVYTLFPEFEDISLDVYDLRPELKERYEEALSTLGDDLPFRINSELYRITVKSAHLNQPMGISMMSAGTKRVVWLLANAIIASRRLGDQLLAIEEVETSIHPRMIHDLLELLQESMGDASLLVTSHSPYLVQYLKPERIYVGVPTGDGTAAFKRLRADRVRDFCAAANARGMGFGEYLYSLMSSDCDGSAVLASYLEA